MYDRLCQDEIGVISRILLTFKGVKCIYKEERCPLN